MSGTGSAAGGADGRASDDAGYHVGFDIGGTRLKTGVVLGDGSVERPTVDDTAALDFDGVLPLIRSHAREHLAAAGPGCRGFGIALPGIVEPAFGSRYLPGKVLGIEDFPLRERLEDEFGVPVRCVNDGQAATLAEWRFGAATGYDDVVGLTLGTGVGSGVVIGGLPFTTSSLGNGVSVGHFTIHTGGKLCLCGNRGCAETLVSANAIAGKLRDALSRLVPSILSEEFARDPRAITFRSLVDGVRAMDRVSIEILDEFTRDLGAVIVTAIHAYNPSIVVVAGGPMAAADLFLADVQRYVDEYAFIFPKDRRIPIVRARLESHAGVLGAVAFVIAELDGPRRSAQA
ncbi:MAG TPA: ROK family protein [Candidatus Limnocylindrales bacterium]